MRQVDKYRVLWKVEPFIFFRRKPFLLVWFLVSFFTLVLVNYVFSGIEQFWDYGFVTGQLLSALAVGFIVSLFFYYLVVYLKQKTYLRNISPRISKSVVRILIYSSNLEGTLFRNMGYSGHDKESIQRVCERIGMFEVPIKSDGPPQSWVDYLSKVARNCKYEIDAILRLEGVDSDLVRILTCLEDSPVFAREQFVAGHHSGSERNRPITLLVHHIFEFFKYVDELEQYWRENFSGLIDEAMDERLNKSRELMNDFVKKK